MQGSGGALRAPSRAMVRWHARWLRAVDACVDWSARSGVCAVRAPGVSAWSVGEQLEHLALADRSILDSMDRLVASAASGGAPAPGRPTAFGWLILTTGYIPRGRAKAPLSTTPGGLDPASLHDAVRANRERVEALGPRLADLEAVRDTSPHPVLGRFTPRRWVQFSGVHHRHHAKIVRDVLRAGSLPLLDSPAGR